MTRSANPEEGPTLLEISEALVENQSQIDELRSLLEKLEGQLVTMRELLAPSEAALRARNEYLDRDRDAMVAKLDKRLNGAVDMLETQRGIVLSLSQEIPRRVDQIENRVLRSLSVSWSATLAVTAMAGFLGGIAASLGRDWYESPPPPQPAITEPAREWWNGLLPDEAAKQSPPGKSRPRPSANASPRSAPTVSK